MKRIAVVYINAYAASQNSHFFKQSDTKGVQTFDFCLRPKANFDNGTAHLEIVAHFKSGQKSP